MCSLFHDLGFCPGSLLSVFIFGSIVYLGIFWERGIKGALEINCFVFQMIKNFLYFFMFLLICDRNISHGKKITLLFICYRWSNTQRAMWHITLFWSGKGAPP